MQTALQFTTSHDLERFNIPHYGPDIKYGDVSKHLYHLWKFNRRQEAAELAVVAGEVFKTPSWVKRYPAQQPQEQSNGQ